LVPLYIFICFLAIVITFNTLHWTQSSTYLLLAKMALMGTRPWGESSLPTVRENAGVVWSLGYEWAFYLFLPALAMVVQGNAPTRILFIFAGLLAVSTHNRLFMFFPGVLAAHAARVPTIARRLKSGYWSLLVIASATALPFATGDEQSWPAFFLTTMIFIPIACGNTLFGLLTLRGLRLMGIVSYSVYLLHGTSLFLATDFLGRVKHGGPNGTLNYWLCVDALACITLIVSICTYRWIEWPFIKLEKRFRKAPSTAEVVLQTQNTAQTGR
jgi:peptidoglycan/LPS O-acetylase OafA/YrhL